MRVQYTGPSNSQEFSKADFKKAELDQDDTVFPKNTAVQVPEKVGAALVSGDAEESPIFFDFDFEEVGVEEAALKGQALQKAVEEANADGANIADDLTAEEKRDALTNFHLQQNS